MRPKLCIQMTLQVFSCFHYLVQKNMGDPAFRCSESPIDDVAVMSATCKKKMEIIML